MKSLTITNLRHIIRHYRHSTEPSERVIRLRASNELISRIKMMRAYKLSLNK